MAPISINGSGSITGISAGGLPDDSIIAADIAAGAVTTAKIADANITAAKLSGAQLGSAPIYGARAFVNFDGTGTVAIRASGNVSSITDNGVGDYTVNFTTAMPDANYSVAHSNGFASVAPAQPTNWSIIVPFGMRTVPYAQAPTTSGFRVLSVIGNDFNNLGVDCGHMMLSVFR